MTSVVKAQGIDGEYLERKRHLILKDIGGKTGSSQKDTWFVGFSNELLMVVWLGFRDFNKKIKKKFRAIKIWNELFLETIPYYQPGPLKYPENLSRKYYCKVSGSLATVNCPRIQSALFLPGQGPKEPCTYHNKKNKMFYR